MSNDIDVTATVRLARECCRSVWNQHYRPLMELGDEFHVWESICGKMRIQASGGRGLAAVASAQYRAKTFRFRSPT